MLRGPQMGQQNCGEWHYQNTITCFSDVDMSAWRGEGKCSF
jgi:hypothetical protein